MRRIKLSFVLLLSAMVLIANLPAFANANANIPGKIYYVATTGSDDNDGSEQAPWRTLQHAADVVKAGETVFVRGGTYKENVTFKGSGSASTGYITFQAYPGESPVISGSASKSSSLVQFYNAHYIIFDGFELTDFEATDASKYISAIKVTDQSSNIVIQNNHIHKINHLASKGNANGIIVYGNSKTAISNIKIANNYLHDLILGSSEALTVVGNVDGFEIENNVIERVNNIGIDVAGFYGSCPSGCTDQARNGVVSGNQVSYVDTIDNPAYRGYRAAAAIYVDGGARIVVERNTVSYSNYGIEVSSEHSKQAATQVIVRNNYIHHNHMSGLIMGGSSSSNGGAINNYILNNTFVSNNELRTGDGEITFQNAVKDNVFANNLFVANQQTPYFYDSKTTNTGNTINYNLYSSDDEAHSYWRIGGVRYTSFEQYQKATKQDQQSLIADPNLLEMSDSYIELASTSPAIDAGTLSYKEVGKLDFAETSRVVGETIDLGAREYDGDAEPPSTEPPSTEPPSTNPPSTEPPAEEPAPFTIDGLTGDWEKISSLATSSSNVKSLKSVIMNDTLYLLITGQLLQEKGQLYINSNQSEHAYFTVPFWSNQKADYLVENGVLYQYTGKGTDWSWKKIKDYRNKEVIIHSSAIEMGLPLAELGNVDQLSLGFIWKDSKSNQLPAGGDMIAVTEADNNEPEPSEPVPSGPTPSPSIVIDGKKDDWSSQSLLAQSNDGTLAMYATHDQEYLYVAYSSSITAKKLQVYLNTDHDAATGYQSSKWKTSGADYLIENGVLYKYGGDNKSWVFHKVIALDQSAYIVKPPFMEMKLSLEQLALQAGDTISIGIMLDDKAALKLPQADKFFDYQLNK